MYMAVSNIGVPQNGWFIMENPLKWMIWGFSHYFWFNTHMSGNPPGNLFRDKKRRKDDFHDDSTKGFEVPKTSENGGTGSIFSPQVLDLKTDVPKPLGFLQWLVGWSSS